MRTLILLAGLLTFVSCGTKGPTTDWVEDCAIALSDGGKCKEPPVIEPPVIEPPPVVQISMDNIQAVWFEGAEVEFFNAQPQGNDFYTEFKLFPESGGEIRLSFFDTGTVYINKFNGAGQHTYGTIDQWEILDNKLLINNTEHGVTL